MSEKGKWIEEITHHFFLMILMGPTSSLSSAKLEVL